MPRAGWLTIVLLSVTSLLSANAQEEALEQTKAQLVEQVANSETFTDWLTEHEGWRGDAHEPEEGTVWYVEFFDADGEWLGYANIDADTGTIEDSFAPRPLPPAVFQRDQGRVRTLVLDDPEVQARLLDPVVWDLYVDFNRFERVWELAFYRGLEGLMVKARLDDDYFSIEEISDLRSLSDEEAQTHARNQAIDLAYGADGAGAALDGTDGWRTYAEHQGGTRWSVSFVADEEELFYALVDVGRGRVLETASQNAP